MKDAFDGDVQFLAFDTGLVRAARQEGFTIPDV